MLNQSIGKHMHVYEWMHEWNETHRNGTERNKHTREMKRDEWMNEQDDVWIV